MMIRIALPERATPLIVEHSGIVALIRRTTAGALMVDERGVRREHAEQAAAPDFETVIQIAVDDLVSLVKPANLFEGFPPGEQTGAGDRGHIALGQCEAKIAGIVALLVAKDVAAHPQLRQEHSRML